MKKTVAVVLAFVFVLALAAPVFAWESVHSTKEGSMDYNFDIKFDGTVDWERQIGHLCNTGAEWKMSAYGEGEMGATGSTKMVPWKLTADTEMDWVTAPDAVENLVVTSVIELCAPPKTRYTSVDWVYDSELGLWVQHPGSSGEYGPWDRYVERRAPVANPEPPAYFHSGIDTWFITDDINDLNTGASNAWYNSPNLALDLADFNDDMADWALYNQQGTFTDANRRGRIDLGPGLNTGGWNRQGGTDLGTAFFWDETDGWVLPFDAYGYGHLGSTRHLGAKGDDYTEVTYNPLTEQIWAVQVEANPGMSGNLHQDFEAAYGPYENWMTDGIGEDEEVHRDAWGFRWDDDGYVDAERGDDYVGNFFNIDQWARTSDGEVRRYIDISSPWSGAYHSEEFEVIGMVEVEEDFEMMNLGEGEETTPDWWDLF